jgi:hypothetical protein
MQRHALNSSRLQYFSRQADIQAFAVRCGQWSEVRTTVFLPACALCGRNEVRILNFPTITAQQIATSLLAVPAFLPATLCTGYLAAWFTDLHGFRKRSYVERVFWSVPLSLAVSTIAAVLIGKFLSVAWAVVFLVAAAVLWLATIAKELLQLRSAGRDLNIGWRPLGGTALLLAILWIAVAVLSLVDLESNHHLFMNLALLDQCFRVDWTGSVLRTGVPPANPLYLYQHPAVMRNYYFWYVLCAVVAKMSNLPVRAVFTASSVWAGFSIAALNGLFLKHFLEAGNRLRRQFLRSIFLFAVTGLDICVILWNIFYFLRPPPFDFEAWSQDPILSWLDTLLWSPNHIAGLVCCMFAFLLAWLGGTAGNSVEQNRFANVGAIALALASAFGLSIYVTFAFFLVMLVWALWQVAIERMPRPALLLAAGGAASIPLLIPYLRELTHTDSKMQGGAPFAFAVRKTFPPDSLMSSRLFQPLASIHPHSALNLARLLLMVPGYAIELGFYLVVLLVYMVPAWRGRAPLSSAQRSLLVIAIATLPFMSFLRSSVLTLNDFGFRSALLLQFPLLLLGSEALTRWNLEDLHRSTSSISTTLRQTTPRWLRSIAALALVLGAIGTVSQALWFRFVVLFAEVANMHEARGGALSHNAWISATGYAQLDSAIPRDAIVQFNPTPQEPNWITADLLGVAHQTAIISDQQGCGSELGGDPSGCPVMAAALNTLFKSATAEQARATCHQFGIQYLVARVYDPAWKNKSTWVWTLNPVVSYDEFRALDCRQWPLR